MALFNFGKKKEKFQFVLSEINGANVDTPVKEQ